MRSFGLKSIRSCSVGDRTDLAIESVPQMLPQQKMPSLEKEANDIGFVKFDLLMLDSLQFCVLSSFHGGFRYY